MFMAKRSVHKRYSAMYGRIAKLYWNENKLTREWAGFTWKRARTGARQTAKVPKAFKAKRKGAATWHFAAEALGRLTRLMVDPQHVYESQWARLQPCAVVGEGGERACGGCARCSEASMPEPKRRRHGTSAFLEKSEQVIARREREAQAREAQAHEAT